MDKRLVKLLQSGKIGRGKIYALDTYNQQVHENTFCTIRTNINTANHHFIYDSMSNRGQLLAEPIAEEPLRIRKLTPRECFRLMGVSETDIDKIQESGVSNSQQYKMAGNSIVVDCLYHIFRKMFTETQCEGRQLALF